MIPHHAEKDPFEVASKRITPQIEFARAYAIRKPAILFLCILFAENISMISS